MLLYVLILLVCLSQEDGSLCERGGGGYHSVTCTVTKVICPFFLFPDSNFVLGNAQAPGCPIVYCSDGFIELTGFTRAQVMGRSCACKFLYGNSTAVMEKDKIDNALEHKEELKTELIFYRKDGRLYLISLAFCRKSNFEPK